MNVLSFTGVGQVELEEKYCEEICVCHAGDIGGGGGNNNNNNKGLLIC